MDVTAMLAEYMHEASVEDLTALTTTIDAHVDRVRQAAETRDFVDLGLARAIGAVLHTLVTESQHYTARERALLFGAVTYFVQHDDALNDLSDPTGLEDDAMMLNAVCGYVGRSDLKVTID